MSNLMKLLTVLMVVVFVAAASNTSIACPMCKIANEDAVDPSTADRPIAYMYSIFFMLTVPALMASGVCYSLYQMNKREAALTRQLEAQFMASN